MSIYQIDKSNNQGEQCWFWHLIDSNDKTIASSKELFLKDNIVQSIKEVRQEVLNALIEESGDSKNQDKGYRFKYHKTASDQQWGWDLLDGNNKVIAAGEVFGPEDNVEGALDNVRKEMGNAKIDWKNPEDDPDYQEKHDDRTDNRGIPGA